MTKEELKELIDSIKPGDSEAIKQAKARQESLAKPPGSLGKLEDFSIKLAGITGRVKNQIEKTRVAVFAADNGVVEEGVSCTPQSVTKSQCINMTMHKTGMSALAKFFSADVLVTDVGVATDINCPGVVDKKIRYSTNNLAKGPAMTYEEALRAIEIGINTARQSKEEGYDCIGIGEMGIGNTTTSACVLAALTEKRAEAVAGRGGGLLDDAFAHKKEVINQGLDINKPDKNDPVDILAKVGGLDLAAMTGAFLGSAIYKLPVVVDGYISIVAALCAVRLCPNVKDYIFLSHASFEVGYKLAADEIGIEPGLLLNMRLGEGSGCPVMFQVLRAACAVMCNMATFADAEINDDYLEEIRKGDAFTV